MKNGHKRLTRAQRGAKGATPQAHRCTGCGHNAPSKFALKEHKDVCRGVPAL